MTTRWDGYAAPVSLSLRRCFSIFLKIIDKLNLNNPGKNKDLINFQNTC